MNDNNDTWHQLKVLRAEVLSRHPADNESFRNGIASAIKAGIEPATIAEWFDLNPEVVDGWAEGRSSPFVGFRITVFKHLQAEAARRQRLTPTR
jgi:hypothetical protein